MVESVAPVLEKWESQMEKAGGVALLRIDKDLKSLCRNDFKSMF